MIPILMALEDTQNTEVQTKIMRLLNLAVCADHSSIMDFCLFGGVPLVLHIGASRLVPQELRLETAKFMRLLVNGSPTASANPADEFTKRVVVSCRGLNAMVTFLRNPYKKSSEINFTGVDGVYAFLNQQASSTRNDFCQLLVRSEALDLVIELLPNLAHDRAKTEQAYHCLEKVVEIISILSTCTATGVKDHLGKRQLLGGIIYLLSSYIANDISNCPVVKGYQAKGTAEFDKIIKEHIKFSTGARRHAKGRSVQLLGIIP
jgi:hypothetical protein